MSQSPRTVPDPFPRLEALVASDPGRRGLAGIRHRNDLRAFAEALLRARGVGLMTGFIHSGSGRAETDGPLGTVALGRALGRLGRHVVYLTDRVGAPLLDALGATPLRVLRLGAARDPGHAATLALGELGVDALVSIERPGRTPDGTYRNLRGGDISDRTDPLDELFPAAEALGLATLAIGDGGNELGMGALAEDDRRALAGSLANASVVPAQHLLVAGVSNWGAYAAVAALSALSGTDLLPDEPAMLDDLRRILAAGAVDGITGAPAATVDGLPYAESVAFVAALGAALPAARPGR